ncbi:hypothetical protein HDU76_007910, partial [Blyttiomyces sp. JEL0837]
VEQQQQYKLYQPATSTILPTVQSYHQHVNVDHRYTSTTLPPIVTLSSTSVPVVQQQQQQQQQPKYYPARVYHIDEQQKDGNYKVQDDMQGDKVVYTPVTAAGSPGVEDVSRSRRSGSDVVVVVGQGQEVNNEERMDGIVGDDDEK